MKVTCAEKCWRPSLWTYRLATSLGFIWLQASLKWLKLIIFFQLNRFNYRSTHHLVTNGFYNFLNWFDERAWYPLGRIVGGTVSNTIGSLIECSEDFYIQLSGISMTFPMSGCGKCSRQLCHEGIKHKSLPAISRTSVQPLLLKPQECLIGGLDLEFKASSVTCSGQCSKVHVWGWGRGRVTLDGITPYYRRRSYCSIPGHINAAGPGSTKKGELYLFPVFQGPLLV